MILPGNYSPHGRTHKILHRLWKRPALVGHLFEALGYPDPVEAPKRKRFWRLVDHLRAHDLIDYDEKVFTIRPFGEDVLDHLDLHHGSISDLAAPRVRFFERAVA